MTLRVIRVGNVRGHDGPERYQLGPELGGDLAVAKAEHGPVVFIVRDEDLPRFQECGDLILDRGRKHPAKALAPVLLGHARIPLVRGGHTSPGQLLRSVRALLERAVRTGDGNVFLVGADAATFAAVWARASESRPQPPTTDDQRPTTTPPLSRSTRMLFELLPELPVPESVRERFVGGSEEVRLVRQLILRAARHQEPVLLLGDTGTGKEVVARLIHDQSVRRFQTFTPVNCGAIPRELLESELFGYEKGAHSTATARKLGLWRMADGGTLFLDEIADLTLDHQVKILRALDQGEIRPVGAERSVRVDARVITATNRDLFAMVRSGEFREDLYYRLRSFMIRTPALRDHPDDVPLLARHFWTRITGEPAANLPPEVLVELGHYRWPGNARELKMVLSTLFALFGPEGLSARHLRAVFEFEGQAGGEISLARPPSPGEFGLHRVECLRQLRRADEVLRAAQVALRPVTSGRGTPVTVAAALAAVEQRVNELDLLCLRPLLFHGDFTFSIVRRVKNRLATLVETLRNQPDRAPTVLKELEADLNLALSTIFKEVDRLLAEAGRAG